MRIKTFLISQREQNWGVKSKQDVLSLTWTLGGTRKLSVTLFVHHQPTTLVCLATLASWYRAKERGTPQSQSGIR